MPKIIIASGPVIVEDNKVLLNQHGDTEFWKFCGGRVEDYETDLIENACREAKEEMGIELEILDENPLLLHTSKETESGKIDVLLVHYLAKRIGDITPGEDIKKWDWVPVENLEKDRVNAKSREDALGQNLGPNIIPALKHFGFVR